MSRLVVIPTPIGNLEDITLRALRELGAVSVILAEDTRHTRALLTHYGIATRLISYHQHNKRARLDVAMDALANGDVALVSSAGTPSLADPGFELVQAAIAAGVDIDVLPGANAAVTAVVGAALPATGFTFLGFLPRKSGDRKAVLAELAPLEQTLVFYEAPHRVVPALRDMFEVLGDRNVVVARELTKIYQEWIRGTLEQVCRRFEASPAKGELTLVVAGASSQVEPDVHAAHVHLRSLRDSGIDRRAALRATGAVYSIPRNVLYDLWLELGESDANQAEAQSERE